MYTDLKRFEKLYIARKFYYYLNYQYSSGTLGLPMNRWLKVLEKINEENHITTCLMWDTSYRSIFDILLKYYHVFEITDKSSKPLLYDIINNNESIIEEFNLTE